jgi:hypothetical protein
MDLIKGNARQIGDDLPRAIKRIPHTLHAYGQTRYVSAALTVRPPPEAMRAIRDFAEVRTFQEATLSARALHGKIIQWFEISVLAALINGIRRVFANLLANNEDLEPYCSPGGN